jgi:hypothetical protein
MKLIGMKVLAVVCCMGVFQSYSQVSDAVYTDTIDTSVLKTSCECSDLSTSLKREFLSKVEFTEDLRIRSDESTERLIMLHRNDVRVSIKCNELANGQPTEVPCPNAEEAESVKAELELVHRVLMMNGESYFHGDY